jgi:hypothetical protein
MYLVNHMLMMTVEIVRVSQTGMKISYTCLEKSAGRKERAANPSMMTVRSNSRRGEDFLAPSLLLCDMP